MHCLLSKKIKRGRNRKKYFFIKKARRKSFYLKSGLKKADYNVMLFGVPMEILTDGSKVSFEEYSALYRNAVGKRLANRIKLL